MGNNLLFHRKEIIITTIDVIHEFGNHGLSTREVAKRVGRVTPTSQKGLFISIYLARKDFI